MMKKRMGDAWVPAADYGRAMPKFSLNLLVREVERSLPFYREILGATVRYADQDFAALNLQGVDFMLHSDHTYDHHPLFERLKPPGLRGTARHGNRSRCGGAKSESSRSNNSPAGNGFSARLARRHARRSGWLHLGRGRRNPLSSSGCLSYWIRIRNDTICAVPLS